MELLHWELGDSDAATLANRVRHEGSDVLSLILVLVLTWVGSGVVIFNYVVDTSSSWTIFVTLAAIGLALSGIVALYRRLRPDPAREERAISSGSVAFTSTGVLVGDHARLWHGSNYALRSVAFQSGRLALDFGARGVLEIPVPARLSSDVAEMAHMLEARTAPLETELLPTEPPRPK